MQMLSSYMIHVKQDVYLSFVQPALNGISAVPKPHERHEMQLLVYPSRLLCTSRTFPSSAQPPSANPHTLCPVACLG